VGGAKVKVTLRIELIKLREHVAVDCRVSFVVRPCGVALRSSQTSALGASFS
jgi:hypothetical protein